MPIIAIPNGAPVTANGEFCFADFRVGTRYLFSVSGNFGGGTATLGFVNPSGVFTPYGGAPYLLTAAAALPVYAPPSPVPDLGVPAISLTGATSPALTIFLTKIRDSNDPSTTPAPIGAVPGLGAGVAAALGKATGSNGSVQLAGEILTPPSIILPDLTNISPPLNAIGLVGGKLVVGNGSAVGGVLVAPRRFTGMSIVALNGQTKAKALTKVFGISMTPEEMAAGRKFRIMGHVVAGPNTQRGTVIPYTNQRMGWSFLGQVNEPQPFQGMFETWKALPLTPPTAFNADYAANRLQRVRYDIATVLGHPSWPQLNNASSGDGGDSSYGVTYYNGGGMTTASAIGNAPQGPAAGIANEVCWMWQVESAASGNYTTETMIFEWDVEIQTII